MTDSDLMEEVKNGRVEKLAVLFERYHVLLYNFFLRLTGNRQNSEDLVQEVFTCILKYRMTFQRRLGSCLHFALLNSVLRHTAQKCKV